MKTQQKHYKAKEDSMSGQSAVLVYYRPDGEARVFETQDFAEVYQFKLLCKQASIPFSVHFNKNNIGEETYQQNKSNKVVQGLKNIFNSILF